jgi:hypothetical protein
MLQAIRRRPLTAEARVRDRSVHVGFVVDKSGTGTDFSTSSSVPPVSITPQWVLHSYTWGMNKRPVGGGSSVT